MRCTHRVIVRLAATASIGCTSSSEQPPPSRAARDSAQTQVQADAAAAETAARRAALAGTERADTVPYRILYRNGLSRLRDHTAEVLRDNSAWTALWQTELRGQLPRPPIDFRTETVLLLGSGTRPVLAGLYPLRVTRSGDTAVAHVLVRGPGQGCVGAGTGGLPILILAVPVGPLRARLVAHEGPPVPCTGASGRAAGPS